MPQLPLLLSAIEKQTGPCSNIWYFFQEMTLFSLRC